MPIKTLEDIAKLHSESNQLRNQQFVLGTVAITVVGFSSWTIPKLSTGAEKVILQVTATVFLQILLNILFIWSIALRRLIGTISAYLRIKEVSDWEKDFYHFSTNKSCAHWSQTAWVRFVYLVLGLFLAVNFALLSVSRNLQLWTEATLLVCISTVLYVCVIIYFARIGHKYDQVVEGKWNSILKEQLETNAPNK